MIKLLVMDVDGVLTDGTINISNNGELFKRFDVKDGLGIVNWQKEGKICAVITARTSNIVENRCKELKIKYIIQGVNDKLKELKKIMDKENITFDEVAFIGDDLLDLPIILKVKETACPYDAITKIKDKVKYVCNHKGGKGAVREYIEYLLNKPRKIIGVIPARYGSTRLVAKPLVKINGKPMIWYVYTNCLKSKYLDEVIIATDDTRIKKAVEKFNGNVIMTSKNHKTGSDRVAEVARKKECDIIVNIQGDEPLINSEVIDKIIEPLIKDKTIQISTAKFKLRDKESIDDPNIVKVITNKNNFAIYFSRSRIPFDKKEYNNYFKHLGIYAYRKSFLLKYAKLSQSELELAESLEQLRILEEGDKIKVVEVNHDSISVDTIEDLKKVERILNDGRN